MTCAAHPEFACFSNLCGVQTLHVARCPAVDYGTEVHRVERFLAADGPIAAGRCGPGRTEGGPMTGLRVPAELRVANALEVGLQACLHVWDGVAWDGVKRIPGEFVAPIRLHDTWLAAPSFRGKKEVDAFVTGRRISDVTAPPRAYALTA